MNEKTAQIKRFKERLDRPYNAWHEYLKQSADSRYDGATLGRLSADLEQGGDPKAKYAAACALLERSLHFNEPNYQLLDEHNRAQKLLMSVIDQTTNASNWTSAKLMLETSHLFSIPASDGIVASGRIVQDISTTRQNLANLFCDLVTLSRDKNYTISDRQHFRGRATETAMLTSILRKDIYQAGFIALPALPWQNNGFSKDAMVGLQVANYETSENFDIALTEIKNPTHVIALQASGVTNPTSYIPSITAVSGAEISGAIDEQNPGLVYDDNSQMVYDLEHLQGEDFWRYVNLAGDYVIDKIAKNPAA